MYIIKVNNHQDVIFPP